MGDNCIEANLATQACQYGKSGTSNGRGRYKRVPALHDWQMATCITDLPS